MTQEEKQLLLKDLCARLPYRVKVHIIGETGAEIDDKLTTSTISHLDRWVVKPYLRSMSSMTDKEWGEFSIFTGKTETYVQQICLDTDSMANPIIGGYKCVYWSLFDKCIDWLNSHHFDFRGLIKKGLALEAPENMYKDD